MIKFLAVGDCETGGLDPQRNALVSVAVVTLDENLNEIERFYSLVKDHPSKIIEDQALAVNGVTRRQIYEEGKPINEVMQKVKEMFSDTIPVFHNGAFDASFLNERGMNIRSCIDTMDLAWKRWPTQKARLGMVVERLGFAVEDAHNSLGDVLMTIKVLKEFCKYPNLDALNPRPINFNRWKR